MFLRKVFRQKQRSAYLHRLVTSNVLILNKTVFIGYLNEIRVGRLSEEGRQFFESLSRPIVYADGIEPTELYVYGP